MFGNKCGWTMLKLHIFLLICFAFLADSKIIELDEDNWHLMLEGEWMVEFFAPWCPACKALKPVWEDFAAWSDDLSISVGQVDVTASPGLSGRFMVTALPTIYHVKDGSFRQYRGARDKNEFVSFIEEKHWESLEEIPAWKSPGSYQMAVIAQFFKLSMVLRSMHSTLVDNYGLPTWGSYMVFAVATILLGAILGLILVCIIDLLFPPKPVPLPTVSISKGDEDEDLLQDTEEHSEHESQASEKEGVENDDAEEEQEEDIRLEDREAESQKSGDDDEEQRGSPSLRKRRARKAD